MVDGDGVVVVPKRLCEFSDVDVKGFLQDLDRFCVGRCSDLVTAKLLLGLYVSWVDCRLGSDFGRLVVDSKFKDLVMYG